MSETLSSPKISSLGPTKVYDAFWHFAAERQAIFMRRQLQENPPWTADPVLINYKFTNVYRASDRVSQFLIQNVIYAGKFDLPNTIFRILLFKLFNKIDTWQLLEKHFDSITTYNFSVDSFGKILDAEMKRGRSIYSGAYIMPSGSKSFKGVRKHETHLQLLDFMLRDNLPKKIEQTKNLKELFQLLRSYPLIGDFLAYQYSIDINYSEATSFSESEFVIPGPGSRSGIKKCFSNLNSKSEAEVIQLVTDAQEEEFLMRGITFQRIGDRSLQLIDIQNIFCEIDKYARIYFPDVKGLSNRSRIKQLFRPTLSDLCHWYPPKWKINEKLTKR